jgi:hypothetical protein
MSLMSRARTLSDRELTLSLLARQLLLQRRPLTAAQAVRRLVALQAQYSPSPYLALHARLDGFAIDDLERALRRGSVVKATLMRGTLHLVHADALPGYAAAWLRQARRMRDGRVPALSERAPELVEELRAYLREPRTTDELRAFTSSLTGGAIAEPTMLLDYARMSLPLVHVPPSGLWRQHGKFSLVLHEQAGVCGEEAAAAAGTVELVRDYLAAFGPATREDLAAFTYLRYHQLDPALTALEPRRLTDARGRELLDLPRAPLPREDDALIPPVRFLPKWDAAVISHRDRTRILPAGFAEVVKGGKNGEVEATWLADGLVAGIWRHEERDGVATLTLRSLTGEGDVPGLEQEARRLLAFLSPTARRHELTLTT